MSFTLNFKLKQHTPLLHFQHYQDDAGLRATEVKPRLDLFFMESKSRLKGEEAVAYIRKNHPNWLVGGGEGEHGALDYRLKFINGKYQQEEELAFTYDEKFNKWFTNPKMYSMVLANMGGKDTKEELKNFRMYESVSVEIFSFHEELLEEIKDVIAPFFAVNNFGNRKSKGFGSFYLDSTDPMYKKPSDVLLTMYDNIVYWTIPEDTHYDNTFNDIDIIYRILKSGFNFPDHPKDDNKKIDLSRKLEFASYQPSFIKNYFIDKYHIGSEKRLIKESFFRPELCIPKDDSLTGYNYVRAILGTAESFEYRDQRKGKVEIKSSEVERFQSAITFKVFGTKVFILPGDWSAIRGKKFVFKTERDATKEIEAPIIDLDLAELLIDYATWFNQIKEPEVTRLVEVLDNSKRKTPYLINNYLNCLEKVVLNILTKPITK